jgi:hypothetical protein
LSTPRNTLSWNARWFFYSLVRAHEPPEHRLRSVTRWSNFVLRDPGVPGGQAIRRTNWLNCSLATKTPSEALLGNRRLLCGSTRGPDGNFGHWSSPVLLPACRPCPSLPLVLRGNVQGSGGRSIASAETSLPCSADLRICRPVDACRINGCHMMVSPNEFVEWTQNGGPRGCRSSMLSAPLRSIHSQRSTAIS